MPQLHPILRNMRKKCTDSGFTIIESIIALIIVAIVVVMILTYFGNGIIHSSDPIARLQTEASVAQVMEKITTYYSQYPRWQPNHSYTANISIVIPTSPNRTGYLYKATSTGTSGSTEPSWSTISPGTTPNDGTVTWVWAKIGGATVPSCAPDLAGLCPGTTYGTTTNCTCPTPSLQSLIGTEGTVVNTQFGSYYVFQNHFIKFDSGGNEVPAGSTTDPAYGRFLKVTIGPNAGSKQTVAALFVLR